MLWYAIRKPEGSYFYPFASHARWCHWAHNTVERIHVQGQKKIYLKNNPGDATHTMETLQDIVQNRNVEELNGLISRMLMYTGNILGSDSYFYRRRKELEGLMDSRGMSTFWFTFSAADNYWCDLHKHSGVNVTGNELEKARQRRKFVCENNHIVDYYFGLRLKALFKTFFGNGCLGTDYVWYRSEYQERGTVHGHGCCWLKYDPGLTLLGKQVVNGRRAQQILTYHQPSAFPEEVCNAEDIALDKWRSDISNIAVTNVEQYLVEIEMGICAQKILLTL